MPVLDALFPGVAAAGAHRYVTRWLARASREDQAGIRKAATALAGAARRRYRCSLGRLGREDLDALLGSFAEVGGGAPGLDVRVFWALRQLALEAALAHPSHGGNRDGWGWRLAGAVGDPQPRGFTAGEVTTATPVASAAAAPLRWTAGLVARPDVRGDEADVCVIGLGAAGGIIAAELAEVGLRVIALEAGAASVRGSTDEKEFQVGRALFWREEETLVVNDGPPQRGSWLARNIGVGGPLHWTTITYRFHPSDFRVRSDVGAIAGTSLADWPISYAETEPYYARAEREIGIAGLAGGNPYEGPRSGPFPFPPITLSRAGTLFADSARRLGHLPYPTPAAIATERHGSRQACNLCGRCSHYDCLRRAKGNTRDTVLARAARTGRLDIRAQSRVERIIVDQRTGRVSGVRYRGPGGSREVTARTFVLATGAAYQARLLLLSVTRAHPRGLANSSGLVGRNLMFHTNVMAWGVFDEPIHADRGPQTGVAFDDLDEDRPRLRHGASFVRGAAVVGGLPLAFAGGPLAFANAAGQTYRLPPGVPLWGAGFREFVARAYTRHFAAFALCEDLPVEANRVELDPTVRLADGGPGLRIHYRYHPNTVAMEEFMVDRVAAVVRGAGARDVVSHRSPVPAGMFAGHHMGTARMGTDPQTSVADADGRAHDAPNLFLPGSGLFVTSAGVNPTGTIFALAYRTAAAIARDHAFGRSDARSP